MGGAGHSLHLLVALEIRGGVLQRISLLLDGLEDKLSDGNMAENKR